MKKLLITLLGILTLTGCSSNKIVDLTYNELEDKIKNKDTFILQITNDGCSACETFYPRFEEIIKDNDLTSYKVNLAKLGNNMNDFNKMFNIKGTPTVIFINKGEEESTYDRIYGAVNNDKIIEKLKKQNYLKD